jgi:hypothetical protein
MNILQPLATSSFLGPNILLSTLFSNILNLNSSINVKHQVSHRYKTIISLSLTISHLLTKWIKVHGQTLYVQKYGE